MAAKARAISATFWQAAGAGDQTEASSGPHRAAGGMLKGKTCLIYLSATLRFRSSCNHVWFLHDLLPVEPNYLFILMLDTSQLLWQGKGPVGT